MILNPNNPFLNDEGQKPKKELYQELMDNAEIYRLRQDSTFIIQGLERKKGILETDQSMDNLRRRQEGRLQMYENNPKIKLIQNQIDDIKKTVWDSYFSGHYDR